jgi:hypothetical protein
VRERERETEREKERERERDRERETEERRKRARLKKFVFERTARQRLPVSSVMRTDTDPRFPNTYEKEYRGLRKRCASRRRRLTQPKR